MGAPGPVCGFPGCLAPRPQRLPVPTRHTCFPWSIWWMTCTSHELLRLAGPPQGDLRGVPRAGIGPMSQAATFLASQPLPAGGTHPLLLVSVSVLESSSFPDVSVCGSHVGIWGPCSLLLSGSMSAFSPPAPQPLRGLLPLCCWGPPLRVPLGAVSSHTWEDLGCPGLAVKPGRPSGPPGTWEGVVAAPGCGGHSRSHASTWGQGGAQGPRIGSSCPAWAALSATHSSGWQASALSPALGQRWSALGPLGPWSSAWWGLRWEEVLLHVSAHSVASAGWTPRPPGPARPSSV